MEGMQKMNELASKIELMTSDQFYRFMMELCKTYLDPIHAAGSCYCRECKYRWRKGWSSQHGDIYACKIKNNSTIKENDFCSYGEKKETEGEDGI